MNENKSLLDYITFDKWNKITSEFLNDNLSSKNQDELECVFEKYSVEKISREAYDNLSDDQKLFLVLYGYHNFISRKTEPKDSFKDLLQQFEEIRSKDELLEIFGIYLTHLIHKAFLALLEEKEGTMDNDALILLSKQIPVDIRNIRVMLPLVPIKSPFSIYIISLLVDLIRNLSRGSEVKYKIRWGWNEISYRKISKNMENHLKFGEQDGQLSFKTLQPHIEKSFQTFMNNMIMSSQWKIPDEEKRKIEILRKNFKKAEYKLPQQLEEIPPAVTKAVEELSNISTIILQDVSDYLQSGTPNLIHYYGKIIFDELGKNALENDEHIIFITPLPAGLVMDYLFKHILDMQRKGWTVDKKYLHICQRVHYLCYLPFPGSEDIRRKLPFYLTEYSYLLYKPKETGVSPKENYIRRLLIGAMKRLDLELAAVTAIDKKNYREIVSMITSIFRREDKRQKEYIRYV